MVIVSRLGERLRNARRLLGEPFASITEDSCGEQLHNLFRIIAMPRLYC
jgi:hypothetical protein